MALFSFTLQLSPRCVWCTHVAVQVQCRGTGCITPLLPWPQVDGLQSETSGRWKFSSTKIVWFSQRKKSWYLVFVLNKTKPFFPFRKKHHAPLPKPLDVSSCVPMLPPIVSTPWQPQRLKQKSRPQISLDAHWRKRVLISLQIYCCPPSNLRFWYNCCELGRFLTKVKKKQSFDASCHMPHVRSVS